MGRSESTRRVRIGCDVGGTFTDGIIMDEDSGRFSFVKVPSTPRDPSVGFMRCILRLLQSTATGADEIVHLFHGTTVATNAIIERRYARTGLLTNEGFTDVLEIARQQRPKVYDLQQERPQVLVPGRWRLGVKVRIDAKGRVLRSLEPDDVRRAAERFLEEKVESVAICFLHSYVNGSHEKEAATIFHQIHPEAFLSLSSDICPTFREFPRVSTTVINAAVLPIVSRYVGTIERELVTNGIRTRLHIVQSNGGILPADAARVRPVNVIESGPAAGVIAAAYVGALAGHRNLISLDMGGTTAKAGLIKEGKPEVVPEFEVGATARAGQQETGAGHPVALPVIDLVEVGAGGGSIAWVDEGGALKVGPQSAGADPGPACYRQGGVEPTVTDANLMLGRLNPAYFLGGEMALDLDAAKQAIDRTITTALGKTTAYAAMGIVEVANSNMLRALRTVSSMRGYDPRDYTLVAFGGAGPLHAAALARDLAIPRVLIPPSPGVTSALGILAADLRLDLGQTFLQPTEEPDIEGIRRIFSTLEQRGLEELRSYGARESDLFVTRSADLRYVGQAYELAVLVPSGPVTPEMVRQMVSEFHDRHARTYGHSAPGAPTETVNLRVSVVSLVVKPRLQEVSAKGNSDRATAGNRRPVYFSELGGFVDCPVYMRTVLHQGDGLVGPAIVEEPDSTTVVNPGFKVTVDRLGDLLMEME